MAGIGVIFLLLFVALGLLLIPARMNNCTAPATMASSRPTAAATQKSGTPSMAVPRIGTTASTQSTTPWVMLRR